MKKTVLDQSIIDKIIFLFSQRKNITQIVKEIGLSRRAVEGCLRDNGLELKTKSQLIADSIPALQQKDVVLDMYETQGLSIKEISIKLGTNEQVVKTAFRRLGIRPRDVSLARSAFMRKSYPDLFNREFMHREYVVAKRSPKHIAVSLGCSAAAVGNALDNLKIRRRNHAQSLRYSAPQQKLNAKLARNLRTRLWISIEGRSKMASAVADLGCSIEDLKKHLENKFHPHPDTGEDMSWSNYGKDGWEIDHVIPLSAFDLSTEQGQRDACRFENLQPLWRNSNRTKSDKVLGQQPIMVPMFIVCGPPGSGKSWVCDQLVGVNYISYDAVPKEQHYHYMVELSKNGRPIVYDPFRKVSTLRARYKDMFNIKVVSIREEPETVMDRLKRRGSKLTLDEVRAHCDRANKNHKIADFCGTSQQVLEYLRTNVSP